VRFQLRVVVQRIQDVLEIGFEQAELRGLRMAVEQGGRRPIAIDAGDIDAGETWGT